MQVPKQVLVTDVVARDGFQNEDRIVSTGDKLRVIEGVIRAGVTSIEVTSFVHPGVVPQLADAAELVAAVPGPDPGNAVPAPERSHRAGRVREGPASGRGRCELCPGTTPDPLDVMGAQGVGNAAMARS